jgi:hypothetical protein
MVLEKIMTDGDSSSSRNDFYTLFTEKVSAEIRAFPLAFPS